MTCSKAIVPLLLCFCAAAALYAQKSPIKFGKVDAADLALTDCDFEPGAAAMVLCDYGDSEFTLRGSEGVAFIQKRHKRVKIFNKNGLEQANIHLRYFAGESGNFEKVRDVKAMCHFLENGQSKSVELSPKEVFTNDIGYGYREISFAIPAVREGSVIEYAYELTSRDLANLRSWYFQQDIPVRYSECRVVMPQFLQFQNVLCGEFSPTSTRSDIIKQDFQGFFGQDAGKTERMSFTEDCDLNQWVMERVPSFQKEPLMGPENALASHMEFQLLRIAFRGGAEYEIMSSYQKFNNTLLEDSNFGKQATPGRFEKGLAEQITAGITDPREKANAILRHLSEKIHWNGHQGLYASQSLSKVYESGKGSFSEINLLAVACMRAAGIQADPVILGTRDYARIHPVFPNSDKFNYVVVVVELDGKLLFGDAATAGLPLGYLPERCLHGSGWRVSKSTPGFLDMQADATGVQHVLANIEPDGKTWKGKLTVRNVGQTAAKVREDQAAGNSGTAGIAQPFLQGLSDWTSQAPQFTHSDNPLSEMIEIPVSREWEDEDILYFKPVLTGSIASNPLTAETRHWPLEFPYAVNYNYVLNMSLPAGYALAEKPGDKVITFGDDKDLVFQYRCAVDGNTVTVLSKVQVKRLQFLPDEYADLQKFFDLVVQKNQELLVLKKN